MKNTCQKGNVVEAKVLARFVEKGYQVFLPFGEGHKCDLVFINDSNELKRVQIKKSRETKYDSFQFNLYSNGGGYNKISYTKNEIDYFATEFEGKYYLIPIEDVKTSKTVSLKRDNVYIF